MSATAEALGSLDPVTLAVTFPGQVELYRGRCLFQEAASSVELQGAAGLTRLSESTVKVPAGVSGITVGSIVRIIESDAAPLLTGDYEVTRVASRTHGLSVSLTVRRAAQSPAPGAA
jgi:hypothetical protein